MLNVNDTFGKGPQAVTDMFASLDSGQSVDDMDAKVLADNCWTRATSLAKAHANEARAWAVAALAGYDFLSRFGKPSAARSASENAAALRSWGLLKSQS